MYLLFSCILCGYSLLINLTILSQHLGWPPNMTKLVQDRIHFEIGAVSFCWGNHGYILTSKDMGEECVAEHWIFPTNQAMKSLPWYCFLIAVAFSVPIPVMNSEYEKCRHQWWFCFHLVWYPSTSLHRYGLTIVHSQRLLSCLCKKSTLRQKNLDYWSPVMSTSFISLQVSWGYIGNKAFNQQSDDWFHQGAIFGFLPLGPPFCRGSTFILLAVCVGDNILSHWFFWPTDFMSFSQDS